LRKHNSYLQLKPSIENLFISFLFLKNIVIKGWAFQKKHLFINQQEFFNRISGDKNSKLLVLKIVVIGLKRRFIVGIKDSIAFLH